MWITTLNKEINGDLFDEESLTRMDSSFVKHHLALQSFLRQFDKERSIISHDELHLIVLKKQQTTNEC